MKNCFILRLAFCVSFLVFFGCNKTSENASVGPKGDFTIEDAKKWYDQTSKSARKSGEGIDKVIWGDATQRRISTEEEIVVVPLLSETFFGCRIKDGREGKSKKDEDNFPAGLIQRNLVIRKIRSKIESMEMRIVFDENYKPKVKEGRIDPVNFEGYVYFFEMNGDLRTGLIYESGKATATFSPNKGGKTSAMIEICTDWYHQGCVDGYGCSGWIYQNTTCEMVFINNSASLGTVFMNALDAAISAGSDAAFDAIMNLPYVSEMWSQLNQKERDYFENKKWMIAQAAFASFTARQLTEWFYCNDSDDGNWNAFKHAVWAAILSMEFGTSTALELTYLHEDTSAPKQKSMDVYNNDLGINTFKSIKSAISSLPATSIGVKTGMIADAILKKIIAGQGQRLVPENAPTGVQQTLLSTTAANRCH
jgi:hypothetical protein